MIIKVNTSKRVVINKLRPEKVWYASNKAKTAMVTEEVEVTKTIRSGPESNTSTAASGNFLSSFSASLN